MRLQVIESEVHDSVLHYSHGMSRKLRRVYFPESGICLTVDGDAFYVLENYAPGGDRVVWEGVDRTGTLHAALELARTYLSAAETLKLIVRTRVGETEKEEEQ